MTSPSDPNVIIAGIRRFGLAPDGADLRDLEAAIARLRASPDNGWQPMATEPNDGAYRFYGLHVKNKSGFSWFEAHYVALNDEGQMILPSGDNFDDWAFSDFECWTPAPPTFPSGQSSPVDAPATNVSDTTSIADRMERADAVGMRFPDMGYWHHLTYDERNVIVAALRSSPVSVPSEADIARIIRSFCVACIRSNDGMTLDTESIAELSVGGIEIAASEIVRRMTSGQSSPGADVAEVISQCAACVPTTWLDPLLTGPDAVWTPDGEGLERVLRAIAERIRSVPSGQR